MSSSALPQNEVKKWRVTFFVIVAGLLTLLMLFGGVRDLLLFSGQSGFPSIIHRWHEAQSGVLTVIVFGGSLLALLLLLAALLAATKQPGWLALGLIAGLAFLYLGIAALFLPDFAGSWGTTG